MQEQVGMDDIPVALLIIQRDYQIIIANKQSHALFGYDAGELIGQHLEVLVPPKVRLFHRQVAEGYWKEPRPLHIGSGRDLSGLKKDGRLIPVEIGLYPYNGNVMVLIVDVAVRHVKQISADLKVLAEKMQKTVEALVS